MQKNLINDKTNHPATQQRLFQIQILKVADFSVLGVLPPT